MPSTFAVSPARLVPVNAAEAVLEPFWDRQLSGLDQWTLEPGEAWGLAVRQDWCWVRFEWARRPPAGTPALRMRRDFDLDVSGYDTLLVSVMAPAGAVFRLAAETDAGRREFAAPPAGSLKKEHALPLRGARRLGRVTLELHAGQEGIASGWFNWVGLQAADLLPRHLAQYRHEDAAWHRYLKPEGFAPAFVPAHGLLVSGPELESLRARYAGALATAPLVARGREALELPPPETLIGDFVNFWGDTRYCRERDHGRSLLAPGPYGHGVYAALAGLLLRDAALLRLAARYALSLARCGRWDDGMVTAFPGSSFDHRCFVQSLCVQEAALILDLAGEWFTGPGRDYVLRRIGEEGLGAIHYNTWKYEYIFHCNQLAWFTPGRMLGCLLLERLWPRVTPYTELAFQDLVESLGHTVLPDGGYLEGPTYFRCVGRDSGLSLYLYARARGLAFDAVVPDVMKRTAAFGAAVASTDDDQDAVPICDAGPRMDSETLSVMAAILPQSAWAGLYRKAVARMGGMPDSLLACLLDPRIPAAGPAPEPLVFLSAMGLLTSTRRLGAETVKLLIMGNQAGAGHTHEDKGSFVLEFAGETFALDPGTCDYSSPLAGEMKNCERHNMLVPVGLAARPHPACPLPADVKPQGRGDAVSFHAALDATPGWEGLYRQWVRTWDSPAPDTLVLRDRWALAEGDGVACYWQTRREVAVDGRTVTLNGRRGTVTIEAPADCCIRVEDVPLFSGVQSRIAFLHARREGEAELRIRLKPRAG